MPEEVVSQGKSTDLLAKIAAFLGIVSTLIGVIVSVSSWRLKTSLDSIDSQLKERTTAVEESKERVARYTWVRSLFPDLTDPDPQKRAFALSVMQLALSDDEAKKLFAALNTSKDENLREAGQAGLQSIQTQDFLGKLIASMNASTAEERKSSVAQLLSQYKNSSTAITLALNTLKEPQIKSTSPSGVINALYFLAGTEETAWTDTQVNDGMGIVSRLQTNSPGPQTAQAVAQLKQKLDKVKALKS